MIVDAAIYIDGKRDSASFVLEGAHQSAKGADRFCWIGLFEPTAQEFDAVRQEFDLHELAVEDAVHAHQRPKLEMYDDTVFVVLKPARYLDASETVELGEILLFIDDDFVVVVRHGATSQLAQTRQQLEREPDALRHGPGAVLLAVVEKVVDDYAEVIRGLEADIEELEKQVFSDAAVIPTERIYKLKREVLEFMSATDPLLDPLDRLARGRFVAVEGELREYFRDAHDHLQRVVDRISVFRDLLTSILEANLTQISVRQSADMRKISAWVAIAAVPTLLAGIWGMNFEFMPELDERWGYPGALGLIASVCSLLYWRFKRSGWL